MTKYIKQEMPDIKGNGDKKCYYRIKSNGNISYKELVHRIAYPGSGLNKGTVMHVLETMFNEMALSLGKGYNITMEGLGHFRATLGIEKGKEMDTIDGNEQKRNAASIMVNGILFRPDRNFVRKTGSYCSLRRGGISRLKKSPYTKEERLELALSYLRNPDTPFMRQSDYVRMTGLSAFKAHEDLLEFRNDPNSGITFSGKRNNIVYFLVSR